MSFDINDMSSLTMEELENVILNSTAEKNKRLYEHSQIPAKVSELTQLYVEGGGDIKDIEAVI